MLLTELSKVDGNMTKMERKKPKRVVTKIGDIFCVEFPDNTKGYFQYIAKDMTQLNSSVIRAFYTHYPIDQDVKIDDVVKDKVDFYAHTILRAGIDFDNWYKIGKSSDIGEENIQNILFTTVPFDFIILPNNEIQKINPLDNWRIWHIGQDMINVGPLPSSLIHKVNHGAVIAFHQIVNRMRLGYYTSNNPINKVVKRCPRPEVHSYLRRDEGDRVTYLCFKGNEFERGIVKDGDSIVRICADENIPAYEQLQKGKFSDTNWDFDDFITEEEFNQIWNSTD